MIRLLTKNIIVAFILSFPVFVFGFEKQVGQLKDQHAEVNDRVLFKTEYRGMSIFLTTTGFSYQIHKAQHVLKNNFQRFETDLDSLIYEFNRVDVDFLDFNQGFTIETYEAIKTKRQYYLSNTSEKVDAEVYNRVVFKNFYDNIDIEFTDYEGVFKYNIIVRPGGNIENIRLNYNSDANVIVKEQEIIINTPIHEIKDFIPASFLVNEVRENVDVHYLEKENGIGYELVNANLEPTDTLIIDPMPHRFFGTYYGGGSEEYVNEITIDEDGYTYITGYTNSLNNIATTGTYQGSLNAVYDVFIAKTNPVGDRVWGTYMGGGSFDRAFGIDYNNGTIYVVGSTYSPAYATSGVHQVNSIDNDDAFVAKFDTSGNRVWCTYYGGDLHDFAASVVTDSDENIYITGHSSSNFNIATAGAHLEVHNGASAAFLAKFDTNGQLEWGTFYGSSFEEGWGIALDSNEDPIFSGFTNSTSGIATVGAHQTVNGGAMDAFLVKFTQNGALEWGTYYGGANDDFGYEIDCDSQDNIYFVGGTSSSNNIFFNSGFQSTPTSIDEGFVAKFDGNGMNLWGTYIGGNEADYLYGVKNYVDDGVLITGITQSAENIATNGAFSDALAGQYDALVMKLSVNGDLQWGTYYGGTFSDHGRGIAINPVNAYFYITGYTMSSTGVSSSNIFQETFGGGNFDGFIAKFCAPIFPSLNYDFSGDLCSDDDELVSIDSTHFFNSFEWNNGSTSNEIDLTTLPTGNYTFYVNSMDTNNCPAYSDTLIFNKYASTPLNIDQNQITYCAGDNLTLWTEDVFDTYVWSTSSNDTLIEVQNSSAGIYVFSLQGTNADGCVSYDTVELTINPNPNASLNVQGSANFCLGQTVDVGVSGTYDLYDWFDGSSGSFVTLVEEDSVWVYVENQFGCGTYSDTVFVNSDLLTPEVVLLSDLPICEDSLVVFGVNNSYDEYEWMDNSEDSTLTVDLGVGTHYVYVNVSNQCGGTGQTDSVEIIIPATTYASITFSEPDSLCTNEEYEFYLDGVFSSIIWQNDLLSDSLVFSAGNSGEYTFTVEAVDTNGCPSFDTLVVDFEDCNLNIIQNEMENSWSLFPNPTSGKAFVKTNINQPLELSIYSTQGELIKTFEIKDGEYIDLASLAKGVYALIPTEQSNRFLPIKIVVQ